MKYKLPLSILAVLTTLVPAALAQNWRGTANGNFSIGTNWGPTTGVPASAIFDSNPTAIPGLQTTITGVGATQFSVLTFNNAATAAYTISGGAFALGNGATGVTVTNAVTTNQVVNSNFFRSVGHSGVQTNAFIASGVGGSTLTLNGTYTGGANTAGSSTIVSLANTTGGYGIFNGVIANPASGGNTVIQKNSNANNSGTWELNGANTFTGGIDLGRGGGDQDNGTLVLGNKQALGVGGSLRIIQTGASARRISANTDLSGANAIANPIVFQGSQGAAIGGSRTITYTAGSNTGTASDVTGLAVGQVLSLNANLPINTVITAISGTTITFSNNAHTGTGAAVATSVVPFTSSGGTVQINGSNNLEFSGTVDITPLNFSNGAAGTATFNVGNTATTTLSGQIRQNGGVAIGTPGSTGNVGSFTKTGAGLMVLSGTNTYTGTTTVSVGTLLINGDQSAATGAVSVASGATLGGFGTIGGATTIASGGFLSPGTSPGLLTFSSSLALNGTTTFEVNGTGRGTTYDGINVGTTLTYGGPISVSFGSVMPAGGLFNLFDFGGQGGTPTSVSIGGSYTGALVDSGATGTYIATLGGQMFSFTLNTGDLTISAIPEPSTFAALAGFAALVGTAASRRRRQA